MFERIRNRIKAAYARRRTIHELQGLTDQELRDVGIARADIPSIARIFDPLA